MSGTEACPRGTHRKAGRKRGRKDNIEMEEMTVGTQMQTAKKRNKERGREKGKGMKEMTEKEPETGKKRNRIK